MAASAVIDALFCIPRNARVTQITDCAPFSDDLTPRMQQCGLVAAVLAPCNCVQCQYQWNCADRRTHEVEDAVRANPSRLRGLASYDPLRIGDSLRWIDEAIESRTLSGAYAQAECCVSGLDAARMYPLYGLCARLRVPVVLDFSSRERWMHHRPQVEVMAADFPELNILLALPGGCDAGSLSALLSRFPHLSFLLTPAELAANPSLTSFVEMEGREHALYRTSARGWEADLECAHTLPLGENARRAYLAENAARHFQVSAMEAGATL